MSKSEGWEGGEEGFAALRLPFGVTMSFAAYRHRTPLRDSCCKIIVSKIWFRSVASTSWLLRFANRTPAWRPTLAAKLPRALRGSMSVDGGLRRESQHRGPRDGVNVMRQR